MFVFGVSPRYTKIVLAAFCAAVLLMLFPHSALAQLGGENIRGDQGLKSGSQAPPGWYLGDMFYFYETDTVVGANGNSLSGPQVNLFGNFFVVSHVSKKKFLGANYAFTVAPAIVNTRLTLPSLNLDASSWGLADMYIQPAQLGWHFKRADALLGYAFFAPVGRFTAGANNNTGLGMWSNEFSGGTTVYFDAARKWHAAATGFYEIHSSKQDLDLKIGDMFTLEGGVGRAFLQGYANAGLAYFGQWKVTEDSGTDVSPLTAGLKGSMFGLGPEINLPLGKHPIFLTFRYLFDVRSRVSTQGQYAFLSVVWAHPSKPDLPAKATCSAQPTEVIPGEPVTVTATADNFDPKHTLTYSWNSTGGKISGPETSGTVDTSGLAAGTYTATARVSDPKKKAAEASCSANFTVKEVPKNPPTLSCSANPSSVQAGTSATVSCTCTSPDNVPVTVGGWTASGGTISGSDNTATLNTTGASAGPITVSATCSDSRGLTSQAASTQVTVENPPPPPPPKANKLGECDFTNMAKIGKPWRVDNECKGRLDDIAKNLQQNADNRVVIVGNAEPTEKRKNLAAERAVNSKAYLTGGEAKLGIDASRIETRTGNAGTKTTEYWIVPAGGSFSGDGTQPVDENSVQPVPDHPHAAPRKAAQQQ
jgi:hypothetical protein